MVFGPYEHPDAKRKRLKSEANRRRYVKYGARIRATNARWHAANRERAIKAMASYATRNSEQFKAYYANYRKSHSAETTANSRAWYAANKARAKATTQAWRKANPEAVRLFDIRRRARETAAEGHHAAADINRIRKQQGNKCAHSWCRVNLRHGYDIDHIQPLSKGGSNWARNIQLLCGSCNGKKHAKDALVFARQNGMLL